MTSLSEILKHAGMITGFVAVMMLLIEYVNVFTRGAWEARLKSHQWGQYVLAVILGTTPGCLGAFTIVAMYSHRSVSLGAVVATMVATSGDEAFVMLAMIPADALMLFAILGLVGLIAGALTDSIAQWYAGPPKAPDHGFEIHEAEICHCFARGQILHQWRNCIPARGILTGSLALFLVALVAGSVGPPVWNWIRVTMAGSCAATLIIAATVPDHFLKEHLWRHVVLTHVPRVFLWTAAALLAMHFLTDWVQIGEALGHRKWLVLLGACLAGLVPESGPHLIFVTLYSEGHVPFSVLMANSIVQDGHGMLPLLADSRRTFVLIKCINLLAGLLIGAAAIGLGY